MAVPTPSLQSKLNHFKRVTSGAKCKIVRHLWLIILNVNIRIVVQIFSLHWIMLNIQLFNVCEARRAFQRH